MDEALRHRPIIQRDGPVPTDSGEHRWLLWASQQADRLDPLVESPPSILDEKAKYERYDYRP